MVMRMINISLILDHGHKAFQIELRQHYNAISELLRHFWSCFPVTSSFLEEKVNILIVISFKII